VTERAKHYINYLRLNLALLFGLTIRRCMVEKSISILEAKEIELLDDLSRQLRDFFGDELIKIALFGSKSRGIRNLIPILISQ
jgi:hypothetical protein